MLTPEQHAARRGVIGGSDAAVACGLSKWRTRVDLWLEKTGRIPPTDLSLNQAVHWGHQLEPVVADEYARVTGHRVQRKPRAYVHRRYPFMIAHVDRIVIGQRRNLECKTAGERSASRWGAAGTDQVPDEYLIQVHHQMLCRGVREADLAVLIGGNDFRIYQFTHDDDLAALIIAKEREFFGFIERDEPPPPETEADVQALHPLDDGNTLIASADAIAAHRELVRIRGEIEALDSRAAELRKQLQIELGPAQRLVDERGRTLVTWRKSADRKRTDYKALTGDLFEQVEALGGNVDRDDAIAIHTTTTPGPRVFRVTEDKQQQ